MKILIVASGYPTEKYKSNGIFEFDQAKALIENGIEVVYAAVDVRSIRRWRKWGYESFVKEGVKIESVSIPCGRIPNNILDKIREFSLCKLYKKIVNKYGVPDLIHSHFIEMGYTTAKLFKDINIPLVHTEHSSRMNQDKLSKYYEYLGNDTYIYMDKVIAVSKYLANNIRSKFNIEAIIIPNIVDTSIFQYKQLIKENNNFNFISVGNLLENKRMDLLINSFNDAFKNNKKVKLFIYGEGPERKCLESLINKFNLTNQVYLFGLVDRKVIARKMQESHCFVLVSRLETFGVAYIEAMAAGLPVISTECGGPENFINKNNGILVPVDNQEKLTNALLNMYNNIKQYDNEIISKKTIENFSSYNIAKILILEYTKMLEGKM